MALESSAEGAALSRWGRVLGGDPAVASRDFAAIAGSYWYPVYAWWRRAGLEADKASRATEASFARWQTIEPPAASDPQADRLREWMLARLNLFAERGCKPVPGGTLMIDRQWAEKRFAKEPERSPDAVFQRRWALTVLEFTVQLLHQEYTAVGKGELFQILLPFLSFAGGEERYAETAPRAGMSSGALHVAVFDFRKRYREILRAFVADTVAKPNDVDNEMTALLCATS